MSEAEKEKTLHEVQDKYKDLMGKMGFRSEINDFE